MVICFSCDVYIPRYTDFRCCFPVFCPEGGCLSEGAKGKGGLVLRGKHGDSPFSPGY